jgi:integrase
MSGLLIAWWKSGDAVVRGQRVEGTTKGGRSRVVSIDRETVTVLREYRRHQAEERLAAGSAWRESGSLVFTTRWGEPLYPDTVTALMSKLINNYNASASTADQRLPHARLHDLRHLHATTLQGSGVALDATFPEKCEGLRPAQLLAGPSRRGGAGRA